MDQPLLNEELIVLNQDACQCYSCIEWLRDDPENPPCLMDCSQCPGCSERDAEYREYLADIYGAQGRDRGFKL